MRGAFLVSWPRLAVSLEVGAELRRHEAQPSSIPNGGDRAGVLEEVDLAAGDAEVARRFIHREK